MQEEGSQRIRDPVQRTWHTRVEPLLSLLEARLLEEVLVAVREVERCAPECVITLETMLGC